MYYSFVNDYSEGAHPAILQKLTETNMEQLSGYGMDTYTKSAVEKIRQACGAPEASVYFLTGGTQTNAVVIGTVLRDCEGVVAAETGHVNVHEAGAIEYTGHKVLTVPGHQGKIHAVELEQYIQAFYANGSHEHMVFPGMTYISYPTEYGTLYTKAELQAIHSVCQKFNMPLFIDGARMGYGLMSKEADMTLKDIAANCEMFYIGGTKIGALCGEALVINKGFEPTYFYTMTKQRGAMLAKSRLNSIQFDTLFTDDLYFKISGHAIEMAEKLKAIFHKKGYSFFLESPTNQQFIILENAQMEALSQYVGFEWWEPYDETHTVVRFAVSWATTQEALDHLESIL